MKIQVELSCMNGKSGPDKSIIKVENYPDNANWIVIRTPSGNGYALRRDELLAAITAVEADDGSFRP